MGPELEFASEAKIAGSMAASYLKLAFKSSEPAALDLSRFDKFSAFSSNPVLLKYEAEKSWESTSSEMLA